MGINAHLHSELQQPNGDWASFHAVHIVDLTKAIDVELPDNYYATTESSMQIKTRIEPDSFILREALTSAPVRPSVGTSALATVHETHAIVQPIPEEIHYRTVLIYQKRDTEPDQLITRIELLSPANKPPAGSYYQRYDAKREEPLAAGINLVEIDYLHETPPVTALQPLIPLYAVRPPTRRDPQTTAYYVAVTRPLGIAPEPEQRGLLLSSEVDIYRFGVETPLPTVAVPLAAGDAAIALDLKAAYKTTYEGQKRWSRSVYYDEEPPAIDIYSPEDQRRILTRLRAVRTAYERGIDLETGPVDVDDYNNEPRSR